MAIFVLVLFLYETERKKKLTKTTKPPHDRSNPSHRDSKSKRRPDPRLVELVRLLGRQAAEVDYRLALAAHDGNQKKGAKS